MVILEEEEKKKEPLGDSSDVTDSDVEDDEEAFGQQAAEEESKQAAAQSSGTGAGQAQSGSPNKANQGAAAANQDEDDVDESQERKATQVINRFTIDMIAEHRDFEEDLKLHWSVGKNSPGEWTKPEDAILPRNSIRWSDNVAVQSLFERNTVYPEYRSLQFVLKWIQEVETPI